MKLNQTSEGIERRGFLKLIAGLPALFYMPSSKSSQSILILETVLAGFIYYDADVIWRNLKVGDGLRLKREPHNHYDQKAIEVFWKDHKLGYVPRVDNSAIAQMMDRGLILEAKIIWLKVNDDPWERIGMNIELVLS